ncbi:MAG: sigma-70 family RNA polymerase sigma factor [Chloroflexi bacterium]|nr:sigma-70 family RNA polymerase sigma factor [Chloroflexota bacterium]
MTEETRAAFQEVVERYGEFVYNVALRVLGNPHDAEDATQEAFLDAYRAWDRFRGEAQVSTWLYRIAVNRSLMRLRKEAKERQLTQTGIEDMQVADWADTPEQAALKGELREKLEEGLGRLPKDLRAAIVLRDVEGLSTAEAAAALGISVPALKARLHRGRLLLRKHLDQYVASMARGP